MRPVFFKSMIDDFIQQLAAAKEPANAFNPYAHGSSTNDARRHNLHLYLSQMAQRQPRCLLVGEAPGYRGGRLTGIPFVSPFILQNGTGKALLGDWRGYQPADEWLAISKEATATIVWETLVGLPQLPLLWNVFPFHPHKPGSVQSNRAPTKQEIEMGRPFLYRLLAIYPIKTIIAVGAKADTALTTWDIPHHKVRHPAHGGKTAFQSGIKALVSNF